MRFFFDVREGPEFYSDDEGMELPDFEAAVHFARVTVAEIGKDAFSAGRTNEVIVEVRAGEKQIARAEIRVSVQRLP